MMTEPRIGDRSAERLNTVATLVIFAALVGVSYRCERAYRRWCKENHPFAAPRARLKRLRTTYRQRGADTIEVAKFTGGLLDELARSSLTD